MADLYQSFKSQTEIDAAREENKKARQLILKNAKRNFEIREAKKEKAKQQGEGTWMLDSVSNRINKDEKDLLKAKKKSKKKKKKKRKKSKKADSSSESSSDSDKEEEGIWLESNASTKPSATGLIKGPQLQRETWMEAPLDLIPTTSRQEIRDAINKNKEEAKREAEKAQQPGQHARELNPYWKDGGVGLPEEKPKSSEKTGSSSISSVGDGGYSWLQKAYTRCVQQAEDEGRSLEEVAAERFGSLEKLEKMFAEVKHKIRSSVVRDSERGQLRNSDRQDRTYERSGRERKKDRSVSRERSESRDKKRERGRNEDRSRRRSRSGERKEKNDGFDKWRERDSERARDKRSRFRRPDSDDERDRKSGGSRPSFRRPNEEEGGSAKWRSSFMRPSESDDRLDERRGSDSRQFVKPGEGKGEEHCRNGRHSRTPEKSVSRWKKKVEGKHDKEDGGKSKETLQRYERQDHRKRKPSLSSSSDSSDDSKSSDNDEDRESEEFVPDAPSEPLPKILSEEELNDLAANILRAEIMGDDDVVAELKSKLEAARRLRETSKSEGTDKQNFSHRRRLEGYERQLKRKGKDKEEGDNMVVLSRTNKAGMVRPVLGSAPAEHWGGKPGKKRKKTAATHDLSGDRTMYFADDNKLDLKSLVEQEKAGTAEDQNTMFARLAGRSVDRDLDVDDMFVSKAAREQNEAGAINRDRSAAIFEHRKINAAMEKCSRCFDKIPKHLIIAIGTKSYLCLPPHRSLTEGHCLIVPMQHVASCVAMDEDVWREMQLFRKSLVQMFLEREQDVVVMETVMHLKHFPHTAIECIPLEKETGDLAPIYFKKAIQEVGPEWADNKKLHSLKEKDVRHVIPKGFPYFSVDFGNEGGYATVIEDESNFPAYFGREIVGGMIDAEPALWRKPHKQSFEDQRQKVLMFEKLWRPHDWTQNLGVGD